MFTRKLTMVRRLLQYIKIFSVAMNVDNMLGISIPIRGYFFQPQTLPCMKSVILRTNIAFSLESKTERYLLHL